jgi:hypothetical protein
MSHDRMSASSVAHKSTGGTLQSLPKPVDPVGNAPDYLTFKTVAPLRQRILVPPTSLAFKRRVMRRPTGTGESLTCRVMPRHFDFLSVGE